MNVYLLLRNNILFKNRNFRYLLIGNAVSQLGNWLFYLTILFFISSHTGSISITSLILFINIVPIVLFSPLAGGVADKYNRKNILVISDLLNGLCSTYLGIRALSGNINLIEVAFISFLIGVGSTFFSPALRSSIPNVVDADELPRANSLMKITSAFTSMLGPLIGGLLMVYISAPMAFILNGISFIISAISETIIVIPQKTTVEERKKTKVFSNFMSGFKYIKRESFIMTIIITFSLMTFFAAPAMIYLKELGDLYYNGHPLVLSALIISDGIGVFIASVYLTFYPLKRHQKTFIVIFPFFCGIALIVVGNIPILLIAVTVMFLQGFISGIGDISMTTILQTDTPDKHRGSVMSFFSLVSSSLVPFAYLISGILLSWFTAPQILTISGGVLMVCSCFLCYQYIQRNLHEFELSKLQHKLKNWG